jgi:hypothetical protein
MSRFVRHSSRRLVTVLALATTTAVPALVVIAGQTPASATDGIGISTVSTTVATVAPDGNKWR